MYALSCLTWGITMVLVCSGDREFVVADAADSEMAFTSNFFVLIFDFPYFDAYHSSHSLLFSFIFFCSVQF